MCILDKTELNHFVLVKVKNTFEQKGKETIRKQLKAVKQRRLPIPAYIITQISGSEIDSYVDTYKLAIPATVCTSLWAG